MFTLDDLRTAVDENPRIRAITRRRCHAAVARWIAYAGADPSLWSPRTAQRFYNGLLTSMKPQSANAVVHYLRHVFRRVAELEQDPDIDIMHTVILTGGTAPERARVLSEYDAQRLCEVRRQVPGEVHPGHLRDFALVVLGLQTGMRRMSMRSLLLEKLETGGAWITVKGGRAFRVPLSAGAQTALAPWLGWLSEKKIRRGPVLRAIGADLKPRGGLSDRGLDEIVGRLGRDAGVALSSHSFRHTFVTWSRLAGAQPFEVAAVTGHATEEGLGGSRGVIERVYTDRTAAGTRAADLIYRPWMAP
jgi:integrase